MRVQQLHLAGFRNYRRLALSLSAGPTIFHGLNGQGKSNLLEAVYLLATSRSFRTRVDRDLLNWDVLADGVPGASFARAAALTERTGGATRLDIVIAAVPDGDRSGGLATRKQITINGVKRQPGELVGHLLVTLFTPADVDLVTGPPELRRRYLDVLLSQTDRQYLRALSAYQRVLAQRNSLLRLLREGRGRVEQLGFWDEELTRSAAYIIDHRLAALQRLQALTAPRYAALTGETASLTIPYVASLDEAAPQEPETTTADRYRAGLKQIRQREVAAGMSLLGPHRDDVQFLLGGRSLAATGSRGQVRSCIVALKLAEVVLMKEITGEEPVLLLDDVLSELDHRRRGFLLAALPVEQQVLITATDLDPFAPEFVARCRRFRVEEGQLNEE